MTQLFTDEMRRDPYPVYEQIRAVSPLLHDPQSGLWMIFDYDGVKRVLGDLECFSSKNGPDWLSFSDPPRHTKLRALISKAFTPRSIMNLEPRITAVVRELLDQAIASSAAATRKNARACEAAHSADLVGVKQIDVASELAIPLPIMVIAEMFGVPSADRARFKRWTDVILRMSYTIGRKDDEAAAAIYDFKAVTAEMNVYLADQLAACRSSASGPSGHDDLLTRLLDAEVDGQRLSHDEMLGFFQLLLLAGSETTTNLINNAILCFIEHPDQLARLRAAPELLPSAIEEVLRFRSPLQWIYRLARRNVELHGQVVPAGRLVLTMVGAANRDPAHFAEADRFDISRDPNPHIAFGHGPHFCLGAALARLEARIALAEFLARVDEFELASDEPWAPRKGLFVLGPTSLPIRIRLSRQSAAADSSRRKSAAV